MLDPNLVVGLHPRVGVGLLHHVVLIAAEIPAAPRGIHGVLDRRADVWLRCGQQREAHGDRRRDALVFDRELMRAHAFDEVLRPGFDIALRAALEQQQKGVAAEAAANIARRELVAQQLGEL